MKIKTMIELLAFGEPSEVRYAEFECEDHTSHEGLLDLAFQFGQNDFQPQQHPSASVGDVIRMNGRFHLIMPCGFKELSLMDQYTYRKMERRDRQFSHFFDEDVDVGDSEFEFELEKM